MTPLNQQSINSENNMSSSSHIRVSVIGISDDQASKLSRILKLSDSRERSYLEISAEDAEQADIVISANPNPVVKDDQVLVSYGNQISNSKFNLQPPLMSFRVLRLLDGIEIKNTHQQQEAVTRTQQVKQDSDESIRRTSQIEDKAAGSNSTQPLTAGNAENHKGYRVLIVDDSELIHKALDIELEKAPFDSNTDYAVSGEDCLNLIAQKQYDIIFLDVMMPGIDGIETCAEIRKLASYKKVPIIMLSAKTSPLDEVKGVMAGCTTYLTKPIKHDAFQKLLDRMGNWLDNYKAG